MTPKLLALAKVCSVLVNTRDVLWHLSKHGGELEKRLAFSILDKNSAHKNKAWFKATRPSNKLEDVNTIKQFCDAVNTTPGEGAVVACRLLAHKIQSPQEREAVQALAVLEACVKSCGPSFHAEVGKFKFLNEMIKLVSPR